MPQTPTPDQQADFDNQDHYFEEHVLTAQDGHRFKLRLFGGGNSGPLLLFNPALGVRGSIYAALGEAWAERGGRFAVADPRGHGSSSQRAGRTCNYGYLEMMWDVDAAAAYLNQRYPEEKIVLCGHSLGGQLSALCCALHPQRYSALALFASCSVYYRHFGTFPYRMSFRLLLGLIPLITQLWGYFPGHRFGFARAEGKQVMRDWAGQGATGRYGVKGLDCDLEAALGKLQLPVLAVPMEGDSFAPRAGLDHLLGKMPQAPSAVLPFTVPGVKPGVGPHFAWAKHPEAIADIVEQWAATANLG